MGICLLQEYSFHDYVTWEAEYLPSDSARKNYEYWRDQLLGAPAGIDIHGELAPTTERVVARSVHRFQLDSALSQQLLALTAEQETTLYKTVLATYQLLMHSACGQQDMVIACDLPRTTAPGTVEGGRSDPERDGHSQHRRRQS